MYLLGSILWLIWQAEGGKSVKIGCKKKQIIDVLVSYSTEKITTNQAG